MPANAFDGPALPNTSSEPDEWNVDDLRRRLSEQYASSASVPSLDLDSVVSRMIGGREAGPQLLRPHGITREQVELAIACVLRHESLAPLLLIGDDGYSQTFCPSMSMALLNAGHTLYSCVWGLAADQLREHGRVPDAEAFRVLAQSAIRHDSAYEVVVNEADLMRLLNYCFGAACDQLDEQAGRRIVIEVIQEYLYARSMGRALDNWRDSGCLPWDWIDRAERIRGELAAFGQGQAHDGPFTTAELRQQVQQQVEIVRGVLVERQLAIVGGPTKSLKTLLVLDLMISMATGTPLLGYAPWQCDRPRRVGFYSGESGATTLLRKHDAICQAKSRRLPPEDQRAFQERINANMVWKTILPDLSDKMMLNRLQQEVRRHRLEVLALDPLLLCMGTAAKDLANAAVTGETLMRANRAVLAEGCTLILVHHPSGDRARQLSPQAHDPLELTGLAYPGITNFVRQWMTINRAAPYEHENRCNRMWLNIGGSGLQAGGIFHVTITEGRDHDRWDVNVETQGGRIDGERQRRDAAEQAETQDRCRRVLEYVRRHPGASLRQMARNRTELRGIGEVGIRDALRSLQSRGAVRSENPPGRDFAIWFVDDHGDLRDSGLVENTSREDNEDARDED
jgi:hypothetical protein